MKHKIAWLLAGLLTLTVLAGCGGPGSADFAWTREGYYTDEKDNHLSVALSDDPDNEGWFVNVTLDSASYGWYIGQEGETLQGVLPGEGDAEITVTLSEEGEAGLLMEVDDGGTYHFVPEDPAESGENQE